MTCAESPPWPENIGANDPGGVRYEHGRRRHLLAPRHRPTRLDPGGSTHGPALRHERPRSRVSRHLPGVSTNALSGLLAVAVPGLDSSKGAALCACAARKTTKPRRC